MWNKKLKDADNCSSYLLLYNKPHQVLMANHSNHMMLTDSMNWEFQKSTEGKALFTQWCLSSQPGWLPWPEVHKTTQARAAGTGGSPSIIAFSFTCL